MVPQFVLSYLIGAVFRFGGGFETVKRTMPLRPAQLPQETQKRSPLGRSSASADGSDDAVEIVAPPFRGLSFRLPVSAEIRPDPFLLRAEGMDFDMSYETAGWDRMPSDSRTESETGGDPDRLNAILYGLL